MLASSIGLLTVGLFCLSLVSVLRCGDGARPIGLAVMVAAVGIGACNFYISFFRRAVYSWRFGSMEGYRFMSVFPLFGNIAVLLGAILGFGSAVCALLGFARHSSRHRRNSLVHRCYLG